MKYFLMLIIFLGSCSDARRMQRVINRHPDWLKVNNPITVHDTIITKSIQNDTAFILKDYTDTFTITKDRLHIKLVHINDTIKVQSIVNGDTIFRTITVPCPPTLVPPKPIAWWQCLFMWMGLVLLMLIIIATVSKILKINIPFLNR